MTEILTESFCERCGTRYTFETARPRSSRISRARTLSRGLRNFVLSDDSFSVAMADARGEEEQAATVLQLDAFHKTFNFCLSCRQYTCGSCWNAEDGRCLSCAPLPDTVQPEDIERPDEVSAAAIEDRLAAIAAPPATAAPQVIGISAWPTADLPPPATEAEPEPAEPPAEAEAAVEPVEVAAELAEPAEPSAVAGAPAGPFAGLSIEDAIAAYEADMAGQAEAVEAWAEPAAVAAEEPEAIAAPEASQVAPEPEAAQAEAVEIAGPEAAEAVQVVAPEEPEAAEVAEAAEAVAPEEPEAVAEPEAAEAVQVAAPEAAETVSRIEAASEPAPATLVQPAAAWLTVAPDDGTAPSWPEQASWPSNSQAPKPGETLLGRRVPHTADATAMWAASAREVAQAGPVRGPSSGPAPIAAPTAQPCVGCGLSLSASARFCRRCGTRQVQA